jgi:hypothetical protein
MSADIVCKMTNLDNRNPLIGTKYVLYSATVKYSHNKPDPEVYYAIELESVNI